MPWSSRAIVLLLGLAAAGCTRQSPAPEQANGTAENVAVATASAHADNELVVVDPIGMLDRSHKGEAAPDVTFQGPAGATTLAAFRGKPVLLNLWATWCAPCVKEMPTLDTLAAAAAGKLAVVPVSQDMQGAAKVDPYFAKAAFKALPRYLDPQLGFGMKMNANLPTTILYDSAGKEVWRMIGGMDWTSPTARELVAEAS